MYSIRIEPSVHTGADAVVLWSRIALSLSAPKTIISMEAALH